VVTLTEDFAVNFIDANVSDAIDMVIERETIFTVVVAETGYHIQVTRDPLDYRMTLKIHAKFTHDNSTDTVFLHISHTRVEAKLEFSGDGMLTTFDTSVPVSITALNIIALLILIQYVWAVREFSEAQQYEKGDGLVRDLLRSVVDPRIPCTHRLVSFRNRVNCLRVRCAGRAICIQNLRSTSAFVSVCMSAVPIWGNVASGMSQLRRK
jgi:hypothetical protein